MDIIASMCIDYDDFLKQLIQGMRAIYYYESRFECDECTRLDAIYNYIKDKPDRAEACREYFKTHDKCLRRVFEFSQRRDNCPDPISKF